MAAQNIRYAELTLHAVDLGAAPASRSRPTSRPSRTRGSPPSGTSACVLRWIYDIPGESGLPAADDTLELRARPRPRGPGRLRPRRPGDRRRPRRSSSDDFDRARAAGLHSVPHAGETTGPQTVWDALRAARRRADRARHLVGRRTPSCWRTSPSTGIPLEVCPTSNIATRAVDALEDHPLRPLSTPGSR